MASVAPGREAPPVSPLAPTSPADLPPLAGVRLASMAAGLKKKQGALDLMLMEFAAGTTVAGVLTKSKCPSAPVDWCRKNLDKGKARAFIVNAGNANAFTGMAGDRTVEHTVSATAKALGAKASEIFVASTGVIGQPVSQDWIGKHVPDLVKKLTRDGWNAASEAIRTTDTFAKRATRTTRIGFETVTINGIAKGSGMIAPDMATMLAFVATDAKLPADVLQTLLKSGADKSFNSITVDSDTSTSDTLLLAATGQATHAKISSASDANLKSFRAALDDLLLDLALQVVRDGEGAQKQIQINVTGASSPKSAKIIARAIANSPLVKTAIAGEDANWGRVVMAVGKAGEPADRDKLSIAFGGTQITKNGQIVDGYNEKPVVEHIKGQEIVIDVDLALGKGAATVWTCDLTHGYIDINGSYRS
ncbi:bifunctional glutamate N-acetyltransferase/amino-acid acetyltransferase ArgJ [Roseiterribacter gracilis]|uniref:Arginine biosynthesis bifunctional protein ArgJ n=1 Tax=Roseiterribacter gracilis TaxID=2812848 RepID=A0A8S8XC08_9PROT|nr:arginine biosynthesis bifunctional protein ArgJ [Rhodospirillales bacterium TMPK1]